MSKHFDKVIFFNRWHNGDQHVSRSFVKYFADEFRKQGKSCYLFHTCGEKILRDLDIPMLKNKKLLVGNHTRVHNNTLQLNTWYKANESLYKKHGLSFDVLFHYFNSISKQYLNKHLKPKNVWDFFPDINFDVYELGKSKEFVSSHDNLVLVCNGKVQSSQIKNFDFKEIISNLAVKFPEKNFLVTNDPIPSGKNIFSTREIIGNEGNDLNENGFLSTHCDYIIGRFSGAYTFAINKTNYRRNVTFINFCSNYHPSWCKKLPTDVKAKIVSSQEVEPTKVEALITKVLS